MKTLWLLLAGGCATVLACSSEPTFTDGDGTGASGGDTGTGASGGDATGASSQGGEGGAGTGASGSGGEPLGGGSVGGSPVGGTSVGGSGTGGAVIGPMCGDGAINGTDECDDGNFTDDDGCSGCVVDCPAWGYKDPVTHHCYFIEGPDDDWFAAENHCENTTPGTTLAVLGSTAEVSLVLLELSFDGVWIGAHDQVNEDEYEWINGEPWTFGDGGGFPWASGQPNNLNNQDCIQLGREDPGEPRRFYDQDCNDNWDALCERTPLEASP